MEDLLKKHDTSLPWHRSSERGEAPSDKAWRRLTNEVDLRLLCIFMVADRVDAPGGWRRNAPTTWFLAQARSRGLLGDLVLDLPDHPSEVCAGAALVTRGARGPEVLVIRTRASAWELPKGGVEWDELPEEAAVRELREEAGATGELIAGRALGHVEYLMGNASERRLKRVVYYLVETDRDPSFADLPSSRTLERRWLRREDLSSVELIHGALARVLHDALNGGHRVVNDIKTNRDLYRFIIELGKRHAESSITLESYLENLRRLARVHRHCAALPLALFASLLEAAFDPPDGEASSVLAAEGYEAWEERISRQIQDLHEMDVSGALADPHRYFGLDAPSGARWYNLDPCTYLECATAGALGGWQEGDDTGRAYVPGPVAVMDASGALTSMDPRDIEEPIVEIAPLTWLDLMDVVEAGQSYE